MCAEVTELLGKGNWNWALAGPASAQPLQHARPCRFSSDFHLSGQQWSEELATEDHNMKSWQQKIIVTLSWIGHLKFSKAFYLMKPFNAYLGVCNSLTPNAAPASNKSMKWVSLTPLFHHTEVTTTNRFVWLLLCSTLVYLKQNLYHFCHHFLQLAHLRLVDVLVTH